MYKMKPLEHEEARKRDRSRTPPDSGSQDASDSRPRKRGNQRSLFENLSKEDWESKRRDWESEKREMEASTKKFEVEWERRRGLQHWERLKEDGAKLRQKIESDPVMIAYLEISRSKQASCRAEEDCFYSQAEGGCGALIQDVYRIRLDGANDFRFWRRTKHYYHVECFDCMVGLQDLIPAKFKLDQQRGDWGLMVRKWYDHKGHIDLDKITACIEQHKVYKKKYDELRGHLNSWYERHLFICDSGPAGCNCPPKPEEPDSLERPVLEDYTTTGSDGIALLDILKHPDVEEVYTDRWLTDREHVKHMQSNREAQSNSSS
ncbi:hypothetical protein B0T10DRAFT_486472 [Thelonectria olida]|uniref:Uncharacterized protein n=1 Tax=Thelonectria olida TaxID=1576542 RepID=A0A9P9ASJ9_9HYPO|nr:hypothetical protein B0T10DRAFT_486472 [Thelonectria olida]